MRRAVWVGFWVICVLFATSWILPPGGELPSLELQGLRYGLIGVAALFGDRGRLGSWTTGWRLAVGGVGFFGFPMVVGEWVRVSVSDISRSALFAMVPVVVVLVVAAGDEDRGERRLLVPALVGIGGLFLLLPVQVSGSLRGRLMLALVCLAVILAGMSSAWLYRLLRDTGWASSVAVVCLANAVFLLISSWIRGDLVWRGSELGSVFSVSSLVDAVEVLLLLWLVRDMMPVRLSARYLVIPLLTILESYGMMRPEVSVRIACGTVLLAAGAGMLLFLKLGEDHTILSLR